MTDQTQLVKFSFNDNSLTFYSFRGRPCVIAADVGRALGYGDEGKGLVETITKNWLDEMIEGTDYMVLTNDDLREFKTTFEDTDESSASSNVVYAARLMILFEPGVNLVCIKTEKPLGRKLRRVLADEVLPKLHRGESIGASALIELQRRIELQADESAKANQRCAQLESRFEELMACLVPDDNATVAVNPDKIIDQVEIALSKVPSGTATTKEIFHLNLRGFLRYAKSSQALGKLLTKYRFKVMGDRYLMGMNSYWWIERSDKTPSVKTSVVPRDS